MREPDAANGPLLESVLVELEAHGGQLRTLARALAGDVTDEVERRKEIDRWRRLLYRVMNGSGISDENAAEMARRLGREDDHFKTVQTPGEGGILRRLEATEEEVRQLRVDLAETRVLLQGVLDRLP